MGLAGFDHFVDLYRSTARLPERDQFLRLYRDSAFRNATAPTRDGMYAFFAPLRSLRDESYYRATLATMARAGTPVTTNMASLMWAQQANAAAINERRRYAYPDPPQASPPPSTVDGKSRDGLWSDIRDMREAGVQILAGTTAENSPRDLPGATLLDELEWLVRAGLTPREALAAATVTPAAVIKRLLPRVRVTGMVAAGEPADLVVLEANPLKDIANARKIFGVIANGRWFGPAERQSLLERAAKLASHPK
jgi:imidazolonepropionase-like amidohydrolase